MHQRDAHCFLELANGLADRGAGHAQPVGSRAEISLIGDHAEDRKRIEIDIHWLENLPIELNIEAVIATMPANYLSCNDAFNG
ncbi:hypothetical protein [Enterobacter cloacae]|uniref:hypothetical protein n=1 Tax=Enterobacter cloacae TaxID=550 RepID=UPI0028DD45BE|nr:hypothetical protein [Enterobacter cloacae]MDT8892999.1 hypothetical protein [Enterobacter cloacae]